MAPIPVLRLLFVVRPGKLVGFLVVFRLVLPPGAIFVVIPVVIVLVVLIVNSDLNVGFLRRRDSHNCHWRDEGGGQEKRSEITT